MGVARGFPCQPLQRLGAVGLLADDDTPPQRGKMSETMDRGLRRCGIVAVLRGEEPTKIQSASTQRSNMSEQPPVHPLGRGPWSDRGRGARQRAVAVDPPCAAGTPSWARDIAAVSCRGPLSGGAADGRPQVAGSARVGLRAKCDTTDRAQPGTAHQQPAEPATTPDPIVLRQSARPHEGPCVPRLDRGLGAAARFRSRRSAGPPYYHAST
jgi:hypothetical protein